MVPLHGWFVMSRRFHQDHEQVSNVLVRPQDIECLGKIWGEMECVSYIFLKILGLR